MLTARLVSCALLRRRFAVGSDIRFRVRFAQRRFPRLPRCKLSSCLLLCLLLRFLRSVCLCLRISVRFRLLVSERVAFRLGFRSLLGLALLVSFIRQSLLLSVLVFALLALVIVPAFMLRGVFRSLRASFLLLFERFLLLGDRLRERGRARSIKPLSESVATNSALSQQQAARAARTVRCCAQPARTQTKAAWLISAQCGRARRDPPAQSGSHAGCRTCSDSRCWPAQIAHPASLAARSLLRSLPPVWQRQVASSTLRQ